jgi:hypothetical protein
MAIALGWQQAAMAGFTEGATAYNNKNYAVALKKSGRWRKPAMPMPSICWA